MLKSETPKPPRSAPCTPGEGRKSPVRRKLSLTQRTGGQLLLEPGLSPISAGLIQQSPNKGIITDQAELIPQGLCPEGIRPPNYRLH